MPSTRHTENGIIRHGQNAPVAGKIELIHERLKVARADYEVRYAKKT